MAEMAEFCGTRRQVMKRVTRICDESIFGGYRGLGETFILSTPRCGGQNHDGCQAAFALLWKSAWLTWDLSTTAGLQSPSGTAMQYCTSPQPSLKNGNAETKITNTQYMRKLYRLQPTA